MNLACSHANPCRVLTDSKHTCDYESGPQSSELQTGPLTTQQGKRFFPLAVLHRSAFEDSYLNAFQVR